jgi:dipeptidyl aminopeptidase/acylaminoacyl peptidase
LLSSTVTSSARPGFSRLMFRVLLALPVLALGVLCAVCWSASEKAIHPRVHGYDWSLATYPDLAAREVHFRTRDGVMLEGRVFSGAKPGLIVLSHGYGDTQDQTLPIAHFLHEAGYGVFTYNMRSRGHSGGFAVSLGALEQGDLISAVDFLRQNPAIRAAAIGAWGISLGGATSILAAASDPRIAAVVDDSGFSDAPNVISTAFEHFIHLPAFPFAPLTVWISKERLGTDINAVRPMDVVSRISPRPVFFIHCLGDTLVPPDNTERTFTRAAEPRQVWFVPGGAHAQAHTIRRAEYEQRVLAFFDRWLNPAASHHP